MEYYRHGHDAHSNFKVVTTRTPILIAHLRPSEPNPAHEALQSRVSAHKIPGFCTLHVSRLKDIREGIASGMASYQRKRNDDCVANGAMWSTEEAKEVYCAYEKFGKEMEKLRACENGVMRLLVR